uniref:ATP synthase complex subunit 8 n=1 Tax=Basilepta melanopus TaxID=2488261 RepID=A0A977K7V8_9CUCU|nr:ATP synthase F0 subunit 8 [Basilepta melanopus]UXC97420.1 ATP synthase F0 subunit 8 [Basilepta melanopus]
MPQMAPLNWLMLFMIFFMTLIMFLVQNYFMKINSMEKKTKIKPKHMINWKW